MTQVIEKIMRNEKEELQIFHTQVDMELSFMLKQ